MKFRFSQAANKVHDTEIVRITEMASKIKDIIPFTVGMPAPETVPVNDLKKIIKEILTDDGLRVFQYSSPKGNIESSIKSLLIDDKIFVDEDNICILTGALQGGFLICRALVSPDDLVISEFPVYSINLQNLRMHAKRIEGVRIDNDGMVTCELRRLLEKIAVSKEKVKIIYTIPDFQNPSGVTMSLKRRKELIEIADEFDVLIFEDTPYRYMRYEGEHLPSLRELGGDRVIHVNSFSKTLSTGLRVGYMVAHPLLIKRFVAIKTATDYCTPLLNQLIVEKFLLKGLWKTQLTNLNNIHRKRRDVFLETLDTYMPEIDDLEWNRPQGGTFLWLTLPDRVNMDKLLENSLQNKVLFVPGTDFYTEDMAKDAPPSMRLNFPYHPEEVIREGIRRLSTAIKATL